MKDNASFQGFNLGKFETISIGRSKLYNIKKNIVVVKIILKVYAMIETTFKVISQSI